MSISTKLPTVIIIWLYAVALTAQQPYATIVNTSSEACESGDVTLSIQFSGEAPFGIQYRIGEVLYTRNHTNLIQTEELDENKIWVSPTTIEMNIPDDAASKTVTIIIERVWDSTVSTPWDETVGTPVTDQNVTFTSWKMPDCNAGSDIDSCGLSAVLHAVPDPVSTTYNWQDPATGTLSDPGDPRALFSAGSPGVYTLTFVQQNGVCMDDEDVEITLKGSPAGIVSTTAEVCGTSPQEAILGLQFSGNGPWDYTLTNGTDQFDFTSASASTSETLTVTGETTFSFIGLTDDNGCPAYPEQISGDATVTDLAPEPNAGTDTAVCGEEAVLSAASSIFSGTWSGPAGISFSDNSNPRATVTSTLYGEQPLVWTELNKGCTASDIVQVRFDQPPTPVDAGEDVKLYQQYSYSLNAAQPGAGQGEWSLLNGAGELTNPNAPTAQISGMEMGMTTLLWSVTNGVCPTRSDSIVITIEGLTYYTGFSPDGDPYNDRFHISGSEQIDNNELIVFNRHGKVVYRKAGFGKEGWDGTDLGGKPLNDGIYYFVFTGDRIETLKDYLVIKTR